MVIVSPFFSGRFETDFVQQAFQNGLKAAGADILDAVVHGLCEVCQRVDCGILEDEGDAFGGHEGFVLADQAGFGLRQDPRKSSLCPAPQLHADRQTALQFRQQVGRLGDVKRARRDEQDVVGLHRPVFGRDRRAFDQRQQVALHAFAADAGAIAPSAAILSISSRKTMPSFSRTAMASWVT
jgi:hypothetical protein